ncbi:MAG: tetratricopeptide repeat protein [Armatimonadetes bacterium]|nr:tetratricopeptide repeat protein [Armatimonadota bacterium]
MEELKQKHYQQALHLFQDALKDGMDTAEVHNRIGDAYVGLNKNDDALKAYEAAIAKNPKMAVAHSNLGYVHKQLGNMDAAMGEFRKAVELDPKDTFSHGQLGLLHQKREAYHDAIQSYRRALELDPQNKVFLNNLGFVYQKINELAKAEEYYDRALTIDPEYRFARNNLSNVNKEKGIQAQALLTFDGDKQAYEFFREAVKLNPNNKEASAGLEAARESLCKRYLDKVQRAKEEKKTKEALQLVTEALQLQPRKELQTKLEKEKRELEKVSGPVTPKPAPSETPKPPTHPAGGYPATSPTPKPVAVKNPQPDKGLPTPPRQYDVSKMDLAVSPKAKQYCGIRCCRLDPIREEFKKQKDPCALLIFDDQELKAFFVAQCYNLSLESQTHVIPAEKIRAYRQCQAENHGNPESAPRPKVGTAPEKESR